MNFTKTLWDLRKELDVSKIPTFFEYEGATYKVSESQESYVGYLGSRGDKWKLHQHYRVTSIKAMKPTLVSKAGILFRITSD